MEYKKYFTVSFDDGLEQDKKLIQLLKKYGVKGTFNLNAGLFGLQQRIGRVGNYGVVEFSEDDKAKKLMFKNAAQHRIPENEIAQVYEGFEVASHGYKHEKLDALSCNEINESISQDVNALSNIVGYSIKGHAYPYGAASPETEKCLKANGIIYARGIKSTNSFAFPSNPLQYNPTNWFFEKNVSENAEAFVNARPETEDLLFMIWGHGYELDFGTKLASWRNFERILEIVSGKQDIVYCTNIDAFTAHLSV